MDSILDSYLVDIWNKLAELDDMEFVKKRATALYTEKFDKLNFELQKYIGDILSDNLESADFISYCNKYLLLY